jgi:hypothetical protein
VIRFAIVIAVAAGLFALHGVLLWAERRGWVYYRYRRPSRSALGNAFLEIQSLVEPEKRQLAEIRRRTDVEEDEDGEPPENQPH